MRVSPRFCRVRSCLTLAGALVFASPGAARAQLVLSVQNVSAAAGSSNDALDVLLTNNGSATTIGGTSFQVKTSNPGVMFTSVTTASVADPYIFAGHSLFGPVINVDSGQAIDASDEYNVGGSGKTIGTGTTLSLGRVFFNVSSSVPTGGLSVTLTPADTLLTDQNGNPLSATINAPAGTITVTPSAVPEPPVPALVGMALLGVLGYHCSRKRRAADVDH